MTNNNYQRNQNYDNNTQVLTLEEFRVSLIYGFDIQNRGLHNYRRGRIPLPSGSLKKFRPEQLKITTDKMHQNEKRGANSPFFSYLSISTIGADGSSS